MSDWWTQPTGAPLELRRLPDASLVLIPSGRAAVATVALSPSRPWRLTAGARAWSMAPYDRGSRFAVVNERDGRPHAWFDRGSGIHGGRILLSPDREYRLRSRLPLFGRWRVTEGRSTIVRLREVSRRDVELLVEPQALPSVPDDAALVIVLACAIAVLQQSTPSIGGANG